MSGALVQTEEQFNAKETSNSVERLFKVIVSWFDDGTVRDQVV